VKLYVQEPGTDRLLSLFGSQSGDRFAVLSISAVELRSAIRRRQRAGDIDAENAAAILDTLQYHLATRFVRQLVNDAVIDQAFETIDRYGLRAYDAVQLAGCLVLSTIGNEPWSFVCSDHRLLEAAKAEQLRVFDPAV